MSVALVFQVRAIDNSRLKKNVGIIDDSKLKELDLILKRMLSL